MRGTVKRNKARSRCSFEKAACFEKVARLWHWLQQGEVDPSMMQAGEVFHLPSMTEKIAMLKIALFALLALSTLVESNAAFACPTGYTPCGETNILCCPA
jgi:hypothetical protein